MESIPLPAIQLSFFTSKPCLDCKVTKPFSEYTKDCAKKDGLSIYCKPCKRARCNGYFLAHPEKADEYFRRYREANIEKVRAATIRWRSNHREKAKAQKARYNARHPERVNARKARWARTHPERHAARTHKRLALIRGNGGSFTASEWKALKAQHDYRCLCCGKQEPEIKLTVDHVLPVILGGSNDISNIQPLCLSCNCRKKDRHIDYRSSVLAG